MRDKIFIAEHRGGLLTKDNHYKLMKWARKCSERVLPLIDGPVDNRLLHALSVARDWENGTVVTGEAMKASVAAHSVARESEDPSSAAVARSIGHAVATAHMADHSTGAALYALKALQISGGQVNIERDWQISQLQQLPPEIVDLVTCTIKKKAKSLKIY